MRGGAKTIKINAIFKKNLLFYSWLSSSQTADVLVIGIDLSVKNREIHGPRARGFYAGVGL